MTVSGGQDGVFENLDVGTEDLVLDDVYRQDLFLDDVESQGLAARVKWIRAGGKEALFRRKALDDTWTRDPLVHVDLKRRIMVATFDFLFWGFFINERWDQDDAWLESVRIRRAGSILGEAREIPKPSR